MGSGKLQLIKQFFAESFIMIAISILLSLGCLWVLWKPFVAQLLDTYVMSTFLFSFRTLALVAASAVLLSIIAGFYPTMNSIRFSPVDVIKNNLNKYLKKGHQRKFLVTTQFSISMGLILCTLLLIRQYNYLQKKDIGFSKDYQVTITMIDEFDKENYQKLKDRLLKLPFVESTAVSNTVIGVKNGFHAFPTSFPDKPDLESFEWNTLGVDEDFLETFDINLTAGRDFDPEIKSDQRLSFIVNEAAAKFLGWEDQMVGKDMELTLYINGTDHRKGKVIGVVQDFHFQSLYEPIKPLILYINKHKYYTDFLNVRLKPVGSIVEQVESLEKVYRGFNPNKPMELTFIRDEIKNRYERERNSSKLMTTFTLLSIVIASLGVFGLAAYTHKRRSKELGVRKVLGASSVHIIKLLVREYFILILISCLVSWPLVYIFSSNWLNNFAYSIHFGPLNYMLGLIIISMIAIASSGIHIVKYLHINPTEFLRDE